MQRIRIRLPDRETREWDGLGRGQTSTDNGRPSSCGSNVAFVALIVRARRQITGEELGTLGNLETWG